MKKSLQISILVLAAIITVLIFTSTSEKDIAAAVTEVPVQSEKIIPQIVKSPDLNRTFTFAGERIPIENFDVRERLDRELSVNTYWHSSTLLNIKKSSRYFPIMDKILKENGLPTDLKYVAVAESNLSNVVSPAGAKGLWQFMTSAGRQYDLEINSEVDERYHVEKATEAACKYFKYLKNRFGSWATVAAAYNMGPTRTARLLEEQRAGSYYDLNLNEETSRYFFRLVAIKEILSRPEDFGFYLDEKDKYPPLDDYTIVEINGAIENIGDFAREHNTSYRMLKIYNPWLIDSRLTNRYRKTYQIKIPNQKF